MARDRDVTDFDQRVPSYEAGWKGELHHRIVDRSLDIALATKSAPDRVLDIGCGTGYLIEKLSQRCPGASALVGIDPAPAMVRVAAASSHDARVRFAIGAAEHVPFANRSFDLIMATTSFDHWRDQREGVAECARLLKPTGLLVITDLLSNLLLTTWFVRRGRTRSVRQVGTLLTSEGFHSVERHNLSGVTVLASSLIRTVTAVR